MNIVGQGFQRGDVQYIRLIRQPAGKRLMHQVVNCRKKRGQGLAAAGGRRYQGMPALFNRRPGILLHRRWVGECAIKPGSRNRMENIG